MRESNAISNVISNVKTDEEYYQFENLPVYTTNLFFKYCKILFYRKHILSINNEYLRSKTGTCFNAEDRWDRKSWRVTNL